MATAFEWYQFKDTGNALGSGNPLDHHNHIFNVSDTLYHFSNKTTFAGLYKSVDDAENWTLHWFGAIGTAMQLGWMTPDFTNGRLYLGYVRTTAGPFYNYQFSYVTLSNGVETGIMDALCDVSYIVRDHFLIGATSIQVMTYENGGDAFLDIYEGGVLSISTNMGTVGILTYDVGPFVVGGTKAYCIWRWSDGNAEIWEFDSGGNTFAEVEDCGAGTSLPTSNQRGVAYDGSNILYFILVNGGLDYLYTYAISTDALTQQQEYNIALMLDRNCVSTSNSPWEFEKAFHTSNDYVYQITKSSNYLLKLQDLNISGQTIKAVTDKYLISSGHDVYKYTESIDEFPRARATYGIYRTPRAEFTYQTSLSTDQLIEIYENASGTYTKAFSGRAGLPKYNNNKAQYDFNSINFGEDDLNRHISYEASTTGIDEAVIAIVNNNSKYLYADTTSVPNIAINITYIWDDQRLRDALYTIAILANGYWFYGPTGYLYFRAYSNIPASGDTFSQATGDLGPPRTRKLQNQFNTWIIYGGINPSTGKPFKKTETDDAHILQYGELVWNGRDNFPEARSQTALDAIATGLKAWQGMQDNPDEAASLITGKYYYPVGYKASYQFTHLAEFASAQDMLIAGVRIDFKSRGMIDTAFSTNIMRRQ